MASGGEDNIFECSVCLNHMLERTPRMLSCIHTFCEKCLSQLIQNKTIHCPVCREITELKQNDVKELRVNFLLAQMKDAQIKPKEATTKAAKVKSKCQICEEGDPVFKCKECSNILCNRCKDSHGKVPEFKSHIVLGLCVKHEDGITHFCKKCVRPLCMKCMLLDHQEHAEQFVSYNAGIKELVKEAETLQEQLSNAKTSVGAYLEKAKLEYENASEVKAYLIKKKDEYLDKAKKAKELIKQIEIKEKEFVEIETSCASNNDKSIVAETALKSLITNPVGICDKFDKIKQKGESTLADLRAQTRTEYTLPNILHLDDSVIWKSPEVITGKKLKLLKLLFSVNKSDKFNCGSQITFVGSDVLLINNVKPQHVIRLNRKGELMIRYYPLMKDEEVRGVAVFENYIYIAQDKSITRVSQFNDDKVLYNPDIDEDINKILVEDQSSILISTGGYYQNGKIIRFDIDKKNTARLTQNLNWPTYINKTGQQGCVKYIVTETGSHQIKVYDQKWNVLHVIGKPGSNDGELTWPYSTAITELGILVADLFNHRVSHFTLEGQFVSHVITNQDGLERPTGLAYAFPYLWVCTESEGVKCYELLYQ